MQITKIKETYSRTGEKSVEMMGSVEIKHRIVSGEVSN